MHVSRLVPDGIQCDSFRAVGTALGLTSVPIRISTIVSYRPRQYRTF